MYLHFLFRPVGFCFSKILRLCRNPPSQNPPVLLPRKSVCCHTLPHRRVRRQPLSRVSRKQRYNTLDFAKQNRVPTGRLAPLLETSRQRGAGLRRRPQSVKRFEALTEPTGETSLCNPTFSSRVHIQTAKGSLSCLLRKHKTAVISILRGMGITAVSF